MVPPAPVRFSTTMVCPSSCESCSNTMRGMMSVELPAAKGTMACNGFAGQLCAPASVVANESMKAGTSIRQIGLMTTSLVVTDSTGSRNYSSNTLSLWTLCLRGISLPPMDLRHLRTFVTVAEQGTVSRAAVRLGIAQPALSRQIQDLEDELRIRLFDRIRRRLVLTGEGEQLLGHCRGILGAVGSLTEQTELLRRPDAGVLKVAATPQTIDGVLSVFLARYARRRPNVLIKLTEAVGASLISLLERGEVHVAISTAGAIQASSHLLETIWLPSLEFVAACSRAIKLTNDTTMDVRGLAAHRLLLLDSSFAVRAAFDAACRVAEFKPNMRLKAGLPTRYWRSPRPATGSRLCHRCCQLIATICKSSASPSGESRCASLMRSRGISDGRCRLQRMISAGHCWPTFETCFRSRGRPIPKLPLW